MEEGICDCNPQWYQSCWPERMPEHLLYELYVQAARGASDSILRLLGSFSPQTVNDC